MAAAGFCFVGRCKRSSPTRCSRTEGYVITLATEKLFGHGPEDDVSVMAWDPSSSRGKLRDRTTVRLKHFRLLANPSGWHGLLGQKCTCFDATLAFGRNCPTSGRDVHHSARGIFDAWTRSESPQLRLRSSRRSEETRGIKEQCCLQCAYSLGQHLDDVSRRSDQTWVSRSGCDATVPGQEATEMHF